MTRGLRTKTRQGLRRALDEVRGRRVEHARGLKRVQRELDAVRSDLAATREQLAQAIERLERRHRSDLIFAADVRATAETELYIAEHGLVQVPWMTHPHATLRHALGLVTVDGLVLEFGVATGTTLGVIAGGLPGRTPYGFDVFSGLPEDWRPGFPAGTFAQDKLPEVPGAQLVVGLFENTLPGFLGDHPGPVAFLHVDVDLYTSAKTVLDLLAGRLVPGTVIVFDEYWNYSGWKTDGEFRAWNEFVRWPVFRQRPR